MNFKKIFESVKKSKKYVHKGNSSFTIKKINDTYGTDKLMDQADFKIYAALFESSKDHEGSKTSNMSTTLISKEAYDSNLKEGKFITVEGDPADDDFEKIVINKDLSEVLKEIKELRSEYLSEEDKLKKKFAKGLNDKEKDIAKREIKTTSKKDDDDPSAYDEWDSDKKYKKRGGKTKESEYTKKYKDKFKKENIYENEKGLKNKSEESGISLSILKKVHSRGMAAWKTGHRPGTTPQQWAMARVNSFITGGKTRTTGDKDLWDKHKGK
tara:strand:- start:19289 stop:20095 length:807 start_codon:yes stop_codon:yes gene_type:complete